MKNPHPRRKFLKSASMTTISAGLALSAGNLALGQIQRINAKRRNIPGNFPIPTKVQQEAVYSFTNGTFEPYVGDIFQAPNARGELVAMKLLSVSVYKVRANTRISTAKAPQPYSFSLTFRAESRLPQFTSIHRVSHPALGTFDLFLTPNQAEDGSLLYEAVFNHLR